MTQLPDDKWLKTYAARKNFTQSPVDYAAYFRDKKVAGKPLSILDMGKVVFPTGEFLVRDPLAYLTRQEPPYFQKLPRGVFPVKTAVVSVAGRDYYALLKIDITGEEAFVYMEALTGRENLEQLGKGEFFGFNVDAGLAAVMDAKTREAFCDFEENWQRDNPAKNIYDDYFAAVFQDNYRKNPQHQRPGGDWINWTVPGTDLNLVMAASGFGDGTYPVYIGYDKNGGICNVILEFIDIEQAFGTPS